MEWAAVVIHVAAFFKKKWAQLSPHLLHPLAHLYFTLPHLPYSWFSVSTLTLSSECYWQHCLPYWPRWMYVLSCTSRDPVKNQSAKVKPF